MCALTGMLLQGELFGQAPLPLRPTPQDELPQTSRINNSTTGTTANRSASTPATSSRLSSSRGTAGSSTRSTFSRVGRAPNMFGDTLPPLISFRTGGGETNADFPSDAFQAPIGGGGSYNISENNTALPTDRVYFVYNAFYNAISSSSGFGTPPTSIDLHRYVAGFEKTFFDGNMSIDVRMPLLSGFDLRNPIYESQMGNVGNLTMFLKGLVYANDDVAFATGLGIGLPTGSDLETRTVPPFNAESLVIRNQAVRLMPFVAGTMNLSDKWFMQSFGQLNFAASGNEVVESGQVVGVLTEQNLLQTDLGLGRWLWQDSGRRVFTGLAGVVELHYTSTIQDSDIVSLRNGPFLFGDVANPANRQDLLNLTSGLQAQLGPLSALRVGAVVPLRDQPDRVFDSEVQVSFNRRF